jgi:hypothetical protein
MTKTLLAAIFTLFFASAAQAQIIGDVDLKATVPGLKANVSATTSVNDNGGADDESDDSSVRANATMQATTSAHASDDDEDESLVITRSDIDEDDTAVYDPADISTEAQLSAYARSIMSADDNIVKIEVDEDEVSIWYKEPGEFLGFIPVTVTTKATVSADGEIEIDRPWYRAFVTAEDETTLENSLSSTAGTIARSEGSTELSSNAQARLLNALRASMKMHYESTTRTSTSTDESTY